MMRNHLAPVTLLIGLHRMGLVEVLRGLSHVALVAVLEEPSTYSMMHQLQPRGSGANGFGEFWTSHLQMLKGSWLLRGH